MLLSRYSCLIFSASEFCKQATATEHHIAVQSSSHGQVLQSAKHCTIRDTSTNMLVQLSSVSASESMPTTAFEQEV